MALELLINGKLQLLPELVAGDSLAAAVTALQLKSDRIAIELNGDIAPRSTWDETALGANDRLEIVQFVGGGLGKAVFG